MHASVPANTSVVVLQFSLCYLLSDWFGTKLLSSTILSVLRKTGAAHTASGMTHWSVFFLAQGPAFCSYGWNLCSGSTLLRDSWFASIITRVVYEDKHFELYTASFSLETMFQYWEPPVGLLGKMGKFALSFLTTSSAQQTVAVMQNDVQPRISAHRPDEHDHKQ